MPIPGKMKLLTFSSIVIVLTVAFYTADAQDSVKRKVRDSGLPANDVDDYKQASKFSSGIVKSLNLPCAIEGCECHSDKKYISCDGLQLTAIPSLKNLTTNGYSSPFKLSFRYNNIASLNFSDLFSVELPIVALDLSNNRIKTIDSKLSKKSKLGPWSTLEELNLSNNKISNLVNLNSWKMNKLLSLDLSENPIEELNQTSFESFKSLTHLYLNKSKISSIHEKTFSTLSELESLVMSGLDPNLMNKLHSELFVANQKLESLDLSSNGLIDVPVALRSLPSIQTLTLNRNNFTSLRTSDFVNKKALTVLDVRYCNELVRVEAGTFGQTNLKIIHLRNNRKFNYISPDAFKTPKSDRKIETELIDLRFNNITTMSNIREFSDLTVKEVRLDKNPWKCDCNIQWLKQFKQGPPIHCASPAKYKDLEISQFFETIDCEMLDENSTVSVIIVTSFIMFLFGLLLAVIIQKSAIYRKFMRNDQYGTLYYTKEDFPVDTV